MAYKTREEWLHAGARALRPWLKELGYETNKNGLLIGCGFPKAGAKDKAIGQCFSPDCTKDKKTHIVVCPTIEDPIEVLGVLLHEIGHDACGIKAGHGPKFKKFMAAVGLQGEATATFVGKKGPLHDRLAQVNKKLGAYPNSPLVPGEGGGKKRKPAGGWVKLVSPEEESYILRISPKALREHGLPQDPWGNEMEEADE